MDKKQEDKKEKNNLGAYQNVEEQPNVGKEPKDGCETRNMENNVKEISKDTMRKLIDLAMVDFNLESYNFHSKMDAWIKEQMGGK